MPDYSSKTAAELATAIFDTKQALSHAQKFLEQLSTAGALKPGIWAALSDSTTQLRCHVLDDLKQLEDALEIAQKKTDQ